MEIRKTITKIAKQVRHWALDQEGSSDDLAYWCAICSAEIFKRLRREGLKPTFCEVNDGNDILGFWPSESHCFVLCNDYLVDVTATQFDKPKSIYLFKANQPPEAEWFWQTETDEHFQVLKSNSPQKLKKHLHDWPTEQNPYKMKLRNC